MRPRGFLFSARPHAHPLTRGENCPKVFSRIEPLNLTTPLPSLSSPSEGEERVAAGRERSGPGSVHGESRPPTLDAHRGHEPGRQTGSAGILAGEFPYPHPDDVPAGMPALPIPVHGEPRPPTLDVHCSHEPRRAGGRPRSQRRDWEDTECRRIFRLCVLAISVPNPAVQGEGESFTSNPGIVTRWSDAASRASRRRREAVPSPGGEHLFSVSQPSRLRVKRASAPCSRVWRRDVARTRRRGRLRYICRRRQTHA